MSPHRRSTPPTAGHRTPLSSLPTTTAARLTPPRLGTNSYLSPVSSSSSRVGVNVSNHHGRSLSPPPLVAAARYNNSLPYMVPPPAVSFAAADDEDLPPSTMPLIPLLLELPDNSHHHHGNENQRPTRRPLTLRRKPLPARHDDNHRNHHPAVNTRSDGDTFDLQRAGLVAASHPPINQDDDEDADDDDGEFDHEVAALCWPPIPTEDPPARGENEETLGDSTAISSPSKFTAAPFSSSVALPGARTTRGSSLRSKYTYERSVSEGKLMMGDQGRLGSHRDAARSKYHRWIVVHGGTSMDHHGRYDYPSRTTDTATATTHKTNPNQVEMATTPILNGIITTNLPSTV